MRKRHDLIGIAVSNEDGVFAQRKLVKRFVTIAGQPANGQPGESSLSHVGNGSEGANDNERAVGFAARQVDGDAAAQRSPVEQNIVSGNLPFLGQPVIGSVGGGVTAGFGRSAAAFAV